MSSHTESIDVAAADRAHEAALSLDTMSAETDALSAENAESAEQEWYELHLGDGRHLRVGERFDLDTVESLLRILSRVDLSAEQDELSVESPELGADDLSAEQDELSVESPELGADDLSAEQDELSVESPELGADDLSAEQDDLSAEVAAM